MLNFTFCSPTNFIFGRGAELSLAEEAPKLGSKILLHYGSERIKTSGLYSTVADQLKKAGIPFVELGGVKPNPALDLVRKGIDLCRREQVSGILAVGGGSVIDSAKAIAAGAPYHGDVWDFFTSKAVVEQALPLATILTIPAAGSEASGSAVVTDEQTQSKFFITNTMKLKPVFSLMNPELTFTLPPYQTAAGVVDMITHVMERYFTHTSHVDLTDRLCESLIRGIVHAAPRVFADPEDYEARAQIMWAGTLAHNELVGLGREEDWASHSIEHELSAQYGVTHGAGLAVVFPAWMKHVWEENVPRFVQYAVRVWDVDYVAGEDERMVAEGIRCLEEFYRSIGMPTRLEELGITDNRYNIMADKALRNGPLGGIRKLKKQNVVTIYELAKAS